jgi:hypothetical protein
MYKRDKAQIDRIRKLSMRIVSQGLLTKKESYPAYHPQMFDFEDDIFEDDIVREPKKRAKVIKIY